MVLGLGFEIQDWFWSQQTRPNIGCIIKASCSLVITWWRHQMETFSMLLALCAGNSLVTGEFPAQRPVTQSFDVFFDLCLNKQLSKCLWGWWFGTPSCSLWHHCNEKSHSYLHSISCLMQSWHKNFPFLASIPILSDLWPTVLHNSPLRWKATLNIQGHHFQSTTNAVRL